jgi:hypothetical protein
MAKRKRPISSKNEFSICFCSHREVFFPGPVTLKCGSAFALAKPMGPRSAAIDMKGFDPSGRASKANGNADLSYKLCNTVVEVPPGESFTVI